MYQRLHGIITQVPQIVSGLTHLPTNTLNNFRIVGINQPLMRLQIFYRDCNAQVNNGFSLEQKTLAPRPRVFAKSEKVTGNAETITIIRIYVRAILWKFGKECTNIPILFPDMYVFLYKFTGTPTLWSLMVKDIQGNREMESDMSFTRVKVLWGVILSCRHSSCRMFIRFISSSSSTCPWLPSNPCYNTAFLIYPPSADISLSELTYPHSSPPLTSLK